MGSNIIYVKFSCLFVKDELKGVRIEMERKVRGVGQVRDENGLDQRVSKKVESSEWVDTKYMWNRTRSWIRCEE